MTTELPFRNLAEAQSVIASHERALADRDQTIKAYAEVFDSLQNLQELLQVKADMLMQACRVLESAPNDHAIYECQARLELCRRDPGLPESCRTQIKAVMDFLRQAQIWRGMWASTDANQKEEHHEPI